MVEIKGLLDCSFVDWKGRLCAVLFLGGCNFRCPFCHNRDLVINSNGMPSIPVIDAISRLERLRPWIDAVCVTGGEPTANPGLAVFLRTLKDTGLEVKLDTNGYLPEMLEKILKMGLVDYVSMDVKTGLEESHYSECVGVRVDIGRIKRSIGLIKASSISHEFRMTVLPRFHTKETMSIWADELKGGGSLLTFQRFSPVNTLDPDFQSEQAFSEAEFEGFTSLIFSQEPRPSGPLRSFSCVHSSV